VTQKNFLGFFIEGLFKKNIFKIIFQKIKVTKIKADRNLQSTLKNDHSLQRAPPVVFMCESLL
jgi:hypothetical protein